MKRFLAFFQEKKCGFSLIELLVVVGLIGVIMVFTVGLLFSILQASRKSEALTTVRQKGSHVLELISTMIRNATEITACSSTSLTITNYDGGSTTFNCSDSSISSNSAVLLSSGVSSCNFSCSFGERGIPDSATIELTLFSEGDLGDQVSLTFTTSASLRNY